MNKATNFFKENIWVWAGTVMVLITLSGQTRKYGLYVSGVAIVAQLITYLINEED